MQVSWLSIALAYNKTPSCRKSKATCGKRFAGRMAKISAVSCARNVKHRTEYGHAPWHPALIPTKEAIMSDNLQNRGGQDRSRINMHEKWEVQYWTKELGVTEEELAKAVKEAGNSADAVRQHISGTRH
jgi:hypothetical protein